MRVKKELKRRTAFRDGKCIVIATEGAVTEYNYFRQLDAESVLSEQRFQIEVLRTENGKSSPNHVLKRLSEYKKKYNIKADDELWMVIDRDRWDIGMLTEIIQACKQKGFGLCVSNSCFEIWLSLHFEDLSQISSQETQDLINNHKIDNKTFSKKRISNVLGREPKNDFSEFLNLLPVACNNAKLLEAKYGTNILSTLGSGVYRIFDGKL